MFQRLHRLIDWLAVTTCKIAGHAKPERVAIWDEYLYYSDIVGYRYVCPRCGDKVKQ